jgi:hypothetical protein
MIKRIFYLFVLVLSTARLSGQVTTIFFDNFDDLTTLGPKWTALPGGSGGVVEVSTTAGINNTRGARMGKTQSNNTYVINKLDLELELDLSAPAQYWLSFLIQDRFDANDPDDGLYLSTDNGASFVKILAFKPADWCEQWGQFPPINLNAFNLTLSSNTIIRFQQAGSGSLPNNDGLYLDNVHVYTQSIAYPAVTFALPFKDDFNAAAMKPAWTWSLADATATLSGLPTRPSGIVGIFNSIGPDNSRAVKMGKSCFDGESAVAFDLHLNLANQSQIAMTFNIQDRFDDTDEDDGIYFSNDSGANFIKIFDFNPSDWCEQWGSFPPLDIDALAAAKGLVLTDKCVIRFQQNGTGNLDNNGGFYLDNVNVYVPALEYATIPFFDNFSAAGLKPAWSVPFATATNTLSGLPTRPSSIVDIMNGIGPDGSRAIRMGKACFDGLATNALDLHLQLAGYTQLALSFAIMDRFDETDTDDGIYFSNDGGLNFIKVFSFHPGDWCEQWGQYPPIDIVALANDTNIALTDQFVIRFQQHGDGSLPNNGGFYIDDVRVYDPNFQYTTVPFPDNFESNPMKPCWRWPFADATNTLAALPTRPSNYMFVEPGIGIGGSRAVAMGKRCFDGPATSAIDLGLKLANQSQVVMTAKINGRFDAFQVDDALYLSNDGGKNFVRVLDLNYAATPGTYSLFTFNISELALEFGLTLTDQFIVRIQQHGDGNLPNNGGIYIDDVNITGVVNLSETIPGIAQVTLTPNPAYHQITLGLTDWNATEPLQYYITDVYGKRLQSGQITDNATIFQTNHLVQGWYAIVLSDGQHTMTRPFLKF